MFRPKLNIAPGHNVMEYKHQSLHNMAKRDVTTINGQVVSVVFVTAEPTFTGVIGAYTTDDGASSVSQSADSVAAQTVASSSPSATTAASSSPDATVSGAAASSASNPFSQYLTASSSPGSSSSLSSSATAPSTPVASPLSSSSASTTRSTLVSTGSADSSNSATSSSTDSEMSTAGKAGLAVGIILAIGAVLGLMLFLLSKKKKQVKREQARQDSEKNAQIAALNSQPSTPAVAPRLSFRPASSFMPEFMGRPKSRLSAGNMLGSAPNEPNEMKEKYLNTPSAGHQAFPMTEKAAPAENPFRDPENPFADPIRSSPAPIAMPEPTPAPKPLPMPVPIAAPMQAPAPSTFHDRATASNTTVLEPVSPILGSTSDKIAVSAASAGAVAAARAAMHHESPRQGVNPKSVQPEPVEMPSPPVSVPAPLAMHKSRPSNASSAGSAVAPAPEGTVYRILMDFTPSMDDELELRAGQVVRMLHEYDDGWCLCTRLDQSRQGVVPRTCLAAKPSKPRPAPGQPPRSMSPAMGPPGPGRSMSPAMRGPPPQGRSMSPGMGGRAMSPARGPQMRSMSPGPRNMGPPRASARSMSPGTGAYNRPPRPLSPGPRPSPRASPRSSTHRSASPGPYGHAGGPKPMAQPRRRSNSSSQAARDVRERRQSPPGPSPLGGAGLGLAI